MLSPVEAWLSVVGAVGGIGVVAGGIGALVGKILSDGVAQRLKATIDDTLAERNADRARDLEILRQQFAQQLEALKIQMQVLAHENQTRFAALHERRAAMLAEFYTLLEDAYRHTSLLTFRAEHQGAAKAATSARDVFRRCAEATSFFNRNKLYFSTTVATKLDQTIKTITKPSADFVFAALSDVPDETVEQAVQEWIESRGGIPEALKAIEQEFRCMLGSEPAVSASTENPKGVTA